MQKILLLEINEVPYKVIDYYCRLRPQSSMAKILRQSAQFETFTEDRQALDPWVSWPTLHRGVPDAKHMILHLGQVLDQVDEAYPPVWRLLRKHGLSVGVFGSLHSSSIPADANSYSFYLPDYFGVQPFAHPSALMPFQELNLQMTRASARNVSRRLPLKSALGFAASGPANGLTFGTLARISEHLIRELFAKELKIRRRNLQPLVAFDLFCKQWSSKKPQFASFYTNHVAASMHRYWGAAFPEDFAGSLEPEWIKRYGSELAAAMETLDIMLGRLLEMVDADGNCTLVLASSMGQAAIPASHTYEFLTIVDLDRFMGAMGVPPDQWQSRPAMVPVQCVTVNADYRQRFISSLRKLGVGTDRMSGHARPTPPMSFDEREAGFFQLFIQYDHFDPELQTTLDGQPVSREQIGLGMMAHEDGINCTAQHVPEGSLLVYPQRSPASNGGQRRRISTLDFVPSVLQEFAIPQPDYMSGNASIRLS
jgi:hypothetical protein